MNQPPNAAEIETVLSDFINMQHCSDCAAFQMDTDWGSFRWEFNCCCLATPRKAPLAELLALNHAEEMKASEESRVPEETK